MLRAGPFSDERVVALANRRFVPFYFDLGDGGAAGDADAREFVVKARPALGGSTVPTPPVLFMTADGDVVAEVSNYSSADQVLASMMKALKDRPEFNEPTEAELALKNPVERAKVLIELRRTEEARELLKDVDEDEAHYLLGRLARFDHHFEEMAAAFSKIESPEYAEDIAAEKLYSAWYGSRFDELVEQAAGFERESRRYTEARYYLGLALYRQGETEEARKVWEDTIEKCAQDPWVYRCDWAHSQSHPKPGGLRQGGFTSQGSKTLLGRIGYMGVRNPDLAGPGG